MTTTTRTPDVAVPDLPDVGAPGIGQRRAQTEAAAAISAGASVTLVGGRGMGRSSGLGATLALADEALAGALIVRTPLSPFDSFSRRFLTLMGEMTRSALVRSRADVVWEALASEWQTRDERIEAVEPTLAEVLRELVDRVRDAAEATDLIVCVVDDLRAWFPIGADLDEARAAADALRWLLDSRTPASFLLLSADSPDIQAMSDEALGTLTEGLVVVPLDPMSSSETEALLSEVAPGLTADDVAHIERMVGGHPGLIAKVGRELARWRQRRGELDEAGRLSLTVALDADVARVVEAGIQVLRRLDQGTIIDRLFEVSTTAEPDAFTPRELTALWPLGLVDERGRVPERVRAVVARGVAIGAGASSRRETATHEQEAALQAMDLEDPAAELGRKERLVFNYLRERAGEPVSPSELIAVYFVNEPEALQDEERSLRTLRATVNRINAKLAPSDRTAKSGWKVVRYARGRGFYADQEALRSLSH